MKRYLRLFIATLLVAGAVLLSWTVANVYSEPSFVIETPAVAEYYIGKVKLTDNISIRLLVLKHCRERIADSESQDIVEVANLAATKGLRIRDIGNHHVDKDGKVDRLVYTKKMTLTSLKAFISEQMEVDADAGDTLIIYTTGHGSSGGSIQILGSRKELGLMFAELAEEHEQETIWWQSSCYAVSGLPKISELNETQQELFSMIASSSANKPSYWGDQEEPMRRVFLAIAEKSKAIDPDQNEMIAAKELRDFLNTVKQGAGDLVFARAPDEPLFGGLNIPNLIPIIDPDGTQRPCPDKYIPTPRKCKTKPKG